MFVDFLLWLGSLFDEKEQGNKKHILLWLNNLINFLLLTHYSSFV